MIEHEIAPNTKLRMPPVPNEKRRSFAGPDGRVDQPNLEVSSLWAVGFQ